MKIEEAAMRWPDLMDYWIAPGNQGPHARNWIDKPHRLLYNLIHLVADARERAEDAERDRAFWIEEHRLTAIVRVKAESDIAAERGVQEAIRQDCYAKVAHAERDRLAVRTVVEETIIPALEHLLEWAEWHKRRHPTPAMGEPNTGARAEAHAALAAARKILE